MAVPPQLIMAAMQMMKNRKSTKDRIKEALAPATDVLKNQIAPLVGMGADAGAMYNLRAEDPSMRTGIATGAVGGAAKGFQAGGIGGLLTGGITGALTGAIATGNVKEQKAEQDKYTYLNQMYGSVVGADTNLQSLLYAEEGGEIVSPEGEVFVPIQTEAKNIGKKLVKEKLIFSDGTIADVNATKPHSQQKKDDVTDIAVEGTYVMPVSTKLSKKDLDSLISYSTSKYSENGKNFAVEKVTVRDILGEKFEGSFAEATDIVTKKYPVMDTEDDLDPITRITNSENIANRSKIIAHLMRLNEAKINKEPIEETKLTPSMKAKAGGYIKKYVLGSTVSGGNPSKPKTALEKRKEKYDQNKPKPVNQYTLKAYEPESKAKKIYKALVAPVSTMDNRANTSYEDPSGLDVAIGVVNPFAWIDGAATVLKSTKDIATGEATGSDYGTVGVSAAAAALGLRGSGAKRVGDKISKFMNNMYNPAAGVSLKKADVPTPTNTLETPEGFQNRVFDSNVQLGQFSGKGHLSESGYNYRVLSPAEIDAIAETKGVFPRAGKQKGGNENTKYWTKGNEKNWYGDKTNLETIRVKQDRFSTDKVVGADDVEVYNKLTGKFEPLSAIKRTPKMSKGGFVSQYVLKPKMIAKKGGYVRKMEEGGLIDPPGKKYKSAKGTIIVGDDGKYYFGKQDGSYIEANPQTVDMFTKQLAASKNPSGGGNPWLLVDGTKGKPILGANPTPKQPRPEITVANDLDPTFRDVNPIYSQEPINILGNAFNSSGSLVPRKKITIPSLPKRANPTLRSMTSPEISDLINTDTNTFIDQMTTPSDTEPIGQFSDLITERKGDAVRDAEEAKTGYKDLRRRVGMRDLMQLGTGLAGIGLQDRTEKRAFKRPLYIDQKYSGLSTQQINQESEAATGAGVEAVKQMMNGGGDRVTSRLAPILIDRLITQQGRTRKAYVDQNTQLERAKYGERGAIQQLNLDEDVRASRVEQDNSNKAIAGTSSLINKYISSASEADIASYKVNEGINRDLTDKLYKLDNQELQVDMIGKDYDMQISEVNKKIADIELELSNTDIDASMKATLKSYQDAYKKQAQDLEKIKIKQNINGN